MSFTPSAFLPCCHLPCTTYIDIDYRTRILIGLLTVFRFLSIIGILIIIRDLIVIWLLIVTRLLIIIRDRTVIWLLIVIPTCNNNSRSNSNATSNNNSSSNSNATSNNNSTSKLKSWKRRSYLSEKRMTLMGFRKFASLPQSSIKKLPIFDKSLATFIFEKVNGLKEINECVDTEAATRMFCEQNCFSKFCNIHMCNTCVGVSFIKLQAWRRCPGNSPRWISPDQISTGKFLPPSPHQCFFYLIFPEVKFHY